jgi:hypothetical protein
MCGRFTSVDSTIFDSSISIAPLRCAEYAWRMCAGAQSCASPVHCTQGTASELTHLKLHSIASVPMRFALVELLSIDHVGVQ